MTSIIITAIIWFVTGILVGRASISHRKAATIALDRFLRENPGHHGAGEMRSYVASQGLQLGGLMNVYIILQELEEAGKVESKWEGDIFPRRKLFRAKLDVTA